MDSEPIHIVEIRESPAGRRCENCYFYDAWYYDHESSQRVRGDFGDCKRFPPVQRALISDADGATSCTNQSVAAIDSPSQKRIDGNSG